MSKQEDTTASSSKSKAIIGIIIAVLILAGVITGALVLKNGNKTSGENNSNSIVESTIDIVDIQFKEESLTLTVGETAALEIKFDPNDANDTDVEFISNDSSIVTVDDKGNVAAIKAGSTTVTVTLKSNESITDSITIDVIDDTDTDSDESTNSDTDSETDTDKDTDISSDTDSKKTAASSESSSKSTESIASSANSTSSANSSNTSSPAASTSSAASQPVTTTVTVQTPTDNTTESNENNQTETPQNENSTPPEDTPPSSDFIDPSSVGKSIPICYVGTDEKKVSISFDASWGNEKTQLILDTLEEYNIKSTFFLVSTWVRAYPDDVKKIAAAGHDIGNHSCSHPDMTTISTAAIRNEMETCSREIEELTGKRPTLFRHPYGAYDNRTIGTALGLGMNSIQWDVDTLDWTNNSGDEICNRIRSRIKNGSIILMHNAGGSTGDSLHQIIQTIYDLGYEIVPISELLPEGDYTTDFTGRLTPKE